VKIAFAFAVAMSCVGVTPAATEQIFTGRLSDSACGTSHQSKASAESLSDRECVFACISALAKYVLVDQQDQVIAIANQDAKGLPLYAGRPVRVTGERRDDRIVVTKIEAMPVPPGAMPANLWDTTPPGH